MLKKRLFSIACAITIATAMCAVTGCGSSQSSGASQQGAGKVDYSALPKIDMSDKKIVLLTQSEEKATTYKEHYGGEVESILVSDKEIFTRFMTMVMSEERVDVFWNYLKPALATQGYLKNLDEYIDFNQPLWRMSRISIICYRIKRESIIVPSPAYSATCVCGITPKFSKSMDWTRRRAMSRREPGTGTFSAIWR